MRNYSKTGGKKGRPAYRTPSAIISKKYLETARKKAHKRNLVEKGVYKQMNSSADKKEIGK